MKKTIIFVVVALVSLGLGYFIWKVKTAVDQKFSFIDNEVSRLDTLELTRSDRYQEIKAEDLENAFIVNSSATFKGYYYQGSDSDFSYFVSKWDFEKDRHFKIAVDKLPIADNLKFKRNRRKLRIDVFQENNKEFAKNEFYTLYVIQDE